MAQLPSEQHANKRGASHLQMESNYLSIMHQEVSHCSNYLFFCDSLSLCVCTARKTLRKDAPATGPFAEEAMNKSAAPALAAAPDAPAAVSTPAATAAAAPIVAPPDAKIPEARPPATAAAADANADKPVAAAVDTAAPAASPAKRAPTSTLTPTSKAGTSKAASPSTTTRSATPGSSSSKVYLPPSKAAAAAAAAAEAALRAQSLPGRTNKRPRDHASSKGGLATADGSAADGTQGVETTTAARRDVLWQQPSVAKAKPNVSESSATAADTSGGSSAGAAAAALVLDTNVDNFFFGDGPTPAQCALPPNNLVATTRDGANDNSSSISSGIGSGSSSSSGGGSSGNKDALLLASQGKETTAEETVAPPTRAPDTSPTTDAAASAAAPSNPAQALVATAEGPVPPAPPRPAGLIGSSFGMAARWGATSGNANTGGFSGASTSVAVASQSNKRPASSLAMGAPSPAKAARPYATARGDSSSSSGSSSSSSSSTLYTSPLSPWYLAGGAPRFGASHGRPEWLDAHKAEEAEKQRKAREDARSALVNAQRANMRPANRPLGASARLTDADWLFSGKENDDNAEDAASAAIAGDSARALLTPGTSSGGTSCSPLEVAAQERAAQRKFMASLTAAIVGHGDQSGSGPKR